MAVTIAIIGLLTHPCKNYAALASAVFCLRYVNFEPCNPRACRPVRADAGYADTGSESLDPVATPLSANIPLMIDNNGDESAFYLQR
jgi:hypothetical protein